MPESIKLHLNQLRQRCFKALRNQKAPDAPTAPPKNEGEALQCLCLIILWWGQCICECIWGSRESSTKLQAISLLCHTVHRNSWGTSSVPHKTSTSMHGAISNITLKKEWQGVYTMCAPHCRKKKCGLSSSSYWNCHSLIIVITPPVCDNVVSFGLFQEMLSRQWGEGSDSWKASSFLQSQFVPGDVRFHMGQFSFCREAFLSRHTMKLSLWGPVWFSQDTLLSMF